jgi:hypothetical protein
VANDVKQQSLEYVEPEHMQVIAAAVINQCEAAAQVPPQPKHTHTPTH